MRVDLLTREYPPEVYGGAGVHVGELVRALRNNLDVRVRCWGADRGEQGTTAYQLPVEQITVNPEQSPFDSGQRALNPALAAQAISLRMAQDADGTDLVHSHTWYANFAGFTAKRLLDVPHVVSAHSLEPLRPWKSEQLGGGYRLSSWIEQSALLDADAVIAVSSGMRSDILRCYPQLDPSKVAVIYNGIDSALWHPVDEAETIRRFGVDTSRPYVIFVGRITRQKGLPYLLRAAKKLPADAQLVLCASAADTPEIRAEVTTLINEIRDDPSLVDLIWIESHLPRP